MDRQRWRVVSCVVFDLHLKSEYFTLALAYSELWHCILVAHSAF